MTRATTELVALFTRALGKPVATPELVSVGGGRRERASFRVFRWECPVCQAGRADPDGIHKPLSIGSDGNVHCNANDCSPDAIGVRVRVLYDTRLLLESIGVAA